MKKLFLIFFLFLNIHGAKVVFDLGGTVLNFISIRAIPTLVYNLGIYNIFKYVKDNGFTTLQNRLFEFENLVYKQYNAESLWLKGTITSEEFYNTLLKAIDDKQYSSFFKNESERRIIKAGLKFLLPEQLAKVTNTYAQSEKTIKKCIDAGHEVFILSNWDNQSFPMIKDKFPTLFAMFPEENIYVSGKLGKCKPNENIYKCLTRNNNPSEYYLIDDDIKNLKTAKALGIKTIHHTGWESTNVKLKNYGILKRKYVNF